MSIIFDFLGAAFYVGCCPNIGLGRCSYGVVTYVSSVKRVRPIGC